MTDAPIVVRPGQGHVVGNVEFLARTVDTPRFNLSIIEIISPGASSRATPTKRRTMRSTSSTGN